MYYIKHKTNEYKKKKKKKHLLKYFIRQIRTDKQNSARSIILARCTNYRKNDLLIIICTNIIFGKFHKDLKYSWVGLRA